MSRRNGQAGREGKVREFKVVIPTSVGAFFSEEFSGTIMTQVIHRPTIFDDQERNPLSAVLCEEYHHPKTQGERFDDPEDPVKDLFVTGYGFIVGYVLQEL